MSEPQKSQIGDGQDNYAGAVKQMANAAKQASKTAATTAATEGAKATANAAAATVKAGVEGGKAVAEIASGTAAGGPWGAIISAAWAMRHTLFKILICICLCLVFLITLIVSLPSIIMDYIFGTDEAPPAPGVTITQTYNDLAGAVSSVIEEGYNTSFAEVENIISGGGYDYDLSMAALINHAQSSAGYDTCYILAAYSASMEQKGTSQDDMLSKMRNVADRMFPVTYVEKTTTRTVTASDGSTTTETVKYVECTIHPFDNTVITDAFGIDVNATYSQFNVTYGVAINNMANSLKMTLYGSLGEGQAVPLTDAELIAYVNSQSVTGARKALLETGLSLVGKVPYFWGGKSAAGWNDEWNTPKLVTAAGSASTGTIRPFGLDCSGFSSWVYLTALGVDIGAGTSGQYPNTVSVSASDLKVGDLGFLAESDGSGWNHVLVFAGYGEGGERMWVHSSGGTGVILNTPSYDSSLVLRRVKNVNLDTAVPVSP